MATKAIESVIAPSTPFYVGDGFRVHHFIPGHPFPTMQRTDPFIMLDYNARQRLEPSETPKGVGAHPHKGFETVTIAYKGSVEHQDSHGGGGVIHEGDVQWMTAGSGLLHKEFHEKEFSRKGGDFQMVQLWVNLPAKDKKVQPRYQAIKAPEMGRHILENNAGTVEVIAGNYKGTQGPAATFTPVHLYNARLNSGASAGFSFPKHYTTALLVIEGNVMVNGQQSVPASHFVLMNDAGEDFRIEAADNALVLVMSGEPINEPIAAHGPFVMNTRDELIEAFEDFNLGKFGYLE
ncbi:MAG TPA: pirin family protein [Edaphocola sp.]|nr:pirin family protein [Edaphocola sp.]